MVPAMSISTTCPACDAPATFADKRAGLRTYCKSCGKPFNVPGEALEEEVELDEGPSVKKKKKKSRGIPLIAWFFGLFALLLPIAAVGALWYFGYIFDRSRLTQENYDQIEAGRTEAEVIKLLGEPTEIDDSKYQAAKKESKGPDPNPKNFVRVLKWKSGAKSIEVDIRFDMVQSFRGTFTKKNN
jgi:hypothetical protein